MTSVGTPPPLSVFVPREIKPQEQRVALTPDLCLELVQAGSPVAVQTGAGRFAGHSDEDYRSAGAEIVEHAATGFARADLIIKVKEPLSEEYGLLRPGQLVFTFLHLAASRTLTEALLQTGASALAYETLVDERGQLPLLTPMSEVAGRLSVQEGARHLLGTTGGRGVLLGGVPGTRPGVVLVIGAGVVGTEAARMAAGLGAEVVLLDRDLGRLRELSLELPANVCLLYSDTGTLRRELARADLVIGAVLLRGALAPRLVSRADLALMKAGSVIVDVAVDQGGVTETTRPTSHADPTYVVDGIIHYAVPNMPGAVPKTSTEALVHATTPYIRLLARYGLDSAVRQDGRLLSALNVYDGQVTEPAVAATFALPYVPAGVALERGAVLRPPAPPSP
jgi:alanine dehydrogenase